MGPVTVRRVDLSAARRLAIAKQRLSGAPRRSSSAAVLDVLRSRLAGFRPEHLDRLAYRERALFEYWAHAASIVLAEDYAIHHYRMRTWPGSGPWGDRVRRWLDVNRTLRRSILADLRRRGPVRVRDLADRAVEGWVSSGWTRDRNVDQMVRFLWVQGRVLVADRRGLEKWWDLAERVLPAEVRAPRLRDVQVTRRAAELSLLGLGVATPRHISGHFTVGRYPGLPRVLAELERAGTIEPVEVGRDGSVLAGPWYVHRDDLALLQRIEGGSWRPRTTLLSPFDNLIHNRARAAGMFGLDYRMEIYVPRAKRRFGYYAMPVLHGDRFVGRVDSAVDRDRERLVVNAVHAEPDVRPTREMGVAVAGAIRELAAWAGVGRVDLEGPAPPAWRRALG